MLQLEQARDTAAQTIAALNTQIEDAARQHARELQLASTDAEVRVFALCVVACPGADSARAVAAASLNARLGCFVQARRNELSSALDGALQSRSKTEETANSLRTRASELHEQLSVAQDLAHQWQRQCHALSTKLKVWFVCWCGATCTAVSTQPHTQLPQW